MTTSLITTRPPSAPARRAGFRQAARMEWIKVRTLRSPWVTLAITVAGVAGLATAAGLNSKDPHGDVTNNILAGVAPGLLAFGVLGALVMTSEYSSGMIKATLAAIPRRGTVLAAKMVVFGLVALLVGEFASFASFFAGTAALPHGVPVPSLSDPAVLRAILVTGAAYPLIGLLGLGFGAIIRHGPAAIAVVVGGVFVGAQALGAIAHAIVEYLPISIVAGSLSVTSPVGLQDRADHLAQWAGLGVLTGYAAVALAAGAMLLARRDA